MGPEFYGMNLLLVLTLLVFYSKNRITYCCDWHCTSFDVRDKRFCVLRFVFVFSRCSAYTRIYMLILTVKGGFVVVDAVQKIKIHVPYSVDVCVIHFACIRLVHLINFSACI